MKLSEIAGDLTLDFKDIKFKLAPLNLQDIGTLERFCINKLTENIEKSGKSPTELELAQLSIFNPLVFNVRDSVEGLIFEIRLSYERGNPNSDFAVLTDLLNKEKDVGSLISTLKSVRDMIEKASGLYTSDPTAESGKKSS